MSPTKPSLANLVHQAVHEEDSLAKFGLDFGGPGTPTKDCLGEGSFEATFGRGDTGTSDESTGFDLSFGRGGLDTLAVTKNRKGQISVEGKASKKVTIVDDTTVTDSACLVKPKSYKTLSDCLPSAGFDFDASKGLASFGKLRTAADGKRRQKEAVIRLPRVQEWPLDSKGGSPGRRRPGDWAFAARELWEQRVIGGSARDVGKSALFRWYGPYLACICLNFLIAGLLVGRSEFLVLQLPLLLVLLAVHLVRVAHWERALHDVVDRCTRDEVKKQLNAPLGWGEGTQIFTANLPCALQAVMDHDGTLMLAQPGSFCGYWLRPVRWAALLLGLLSLFRLVRLGISPGSMWADVWESLEVAFGVVGVLIFGFVGCSHSQAGTPRKVEADRRLEGLEAAFNAMLDVLRPLLGSSAGPVDFGSSSGVPALAADMLANKQHTSTHFSVRLINAEGQTLRSNLVLDFASGKTLLATCPLAGFAFSFGGAESAMPTDLGSVGALGAEALLAAGGASQAVAADNQNWASTLMARLSSIRHHRQQDDTVSISISSASTANTLRSKRSDIIDELSLHLAANMLKTLSSRRAPPLEAFRAGCLGGCGVMPPKAGLEEPCLVLAFSPQRLLSSEPQLASQKGKGVGRGMPADPTGVLRDTRELDRLLHPDRCPSGDTPRSSVASNGSVPTLSDADEESGSPSFGTSACYKFAVKRPSADVSVQWHLAILFDTYAERDLCLSVLRSIGFLPRVGEP